MRKTISPQRIINFTFHPIRKSSEVLSKKDKVEEQKDKKIKEKDLNEILMEFTDKNLFKKFSLIFITLFMTGISFSL